MKTSMSTVTPNILPVYLSCQKEIDLWEKWELNPSLILCGDPELTEDFRLVSCDGGHPKVLYLKCPDTYEDLPFKMVCAFHAILKTKELHEYTHFLKADGHDTDINKSTLKTLQAQDTSLLEYGGRRVCSREGSRKWHFGKVSPDSLWNDRTYKGSYVPWANGGFSYILSRDSLKLICKTYSPNHYNHIYRDHIYEDLMVGLILNHYGVSPVELSY